MSIFGTILSKLFPKSHPAVANAGNTTAEATSGQATPTGTVGTSGTATPSAPPVDVEQILNDMAAKNPQKLNWKTSIVDLMKLLDLDSSFASRQALARELHYSGDMSDSAAVNIWLHRQVMTKLAQNGGKVPADLRD